MEIFIQPAAATNTHIHTQTRFENIEQITPTCMKVGRGSGMLFFYMREFVSA